MLVLFDLASVAFLLALVLSPLVRDASRRIGLVDRPDARRKIHQQPIPRVGGVAVAFAYAGALAFILVAPYQETPLDISRALGAGLALLPAATVVFLTGLMDDIKGLKPWQKLIGQATAAALAYFVGFGVQVFRGHPLEVWISFPLTLVWLVGCTNALNLIDGLDGLAAGIGFFGSLTMLVAALIDHNFELAMVTAPLAGSLLGFLRYNFNPASVFLGDSGSLLIGFLLGCYGAFWSHKSATILGMTAPLMALAIPLLDTGVAIVRRMLRGQSILRADREHIHHRLLDRGLTPRRAALLLYAACGAGAALSLLQTVVHNDFRGLIIVLFCGAAWIGVQHLGYAEFGIVGRVLFGWSVRGLVTVQLELQQFERELASAPALERAWEVIERHAKEFGFRGVRLNLEGRTFQSEYPAGEAGPVWQLRVPLGGSQYLNLSCDSASETHPLLLSGYPEVILRTVRARTPRYHNGSQHSIDAPPETVKIPLSSAACGRIAVGRVDSSPASR